VKFLLKVDCLVSLLQLLCPQLPRVLSFLLVVQIVKDVVWQLLLLGSLENLVTRTLYLIVSRYRLTSAVNLILCGESVLV